MVLKRLSCLLQARCCLMSSSPRNPTPSLLRPFQRAPVEGARSSFRPFVYCLDSLALACSQLLTSCRALPPPHLLEHRSRGENTGAACGQRAWQRFPFECPAGRKDVPKSAGPCCGGEVIPKRWDYLRNDVIHFKQGGRAQSGTNGNSPCSSSGCCWSLVHGVLTNTKMPCLDKLPLGRVVSSYVQRPSM